jgi:uncharacterized phiE125 gp8 family phage protein
MTILSLVTAPATPLIDPATLRDHLRVDSTDQDLVIASLTAAAVARLDGWTGILGRAIQSQVWRQEFSGWGDALRLALPDVTEIAVTAQDANGVAVVPTAIVLKRDAEGWYVQADGPATATRIFVNMTCAMPAHLLPMVKTAVIMLVGHWFEHREAVSDVTMGEVPMSVNALLAPLRRAAF